jgi:hypothetical protein
MTFLCQVIKYNSLFEKNRFDKVCIHNEALRISKLNDDNTFEARFSKNRKEIYSITLR